MRAITQLILTSPIINNAILMRHITKSTAQITCPNDSAHFGPGARHVPDEDVHDQQGQEPSKVDECQHAHQHGGHVQHRHCQRDDVIGEDYGEAHIPPSLVPSLSIYIRLLSNRCRLAVWLYNYICVPSMFWFIIDAQWPHTKQWMMRRIVYRIRVAASSATTTPTQRFTQYGSRSSGGNIVYFLNFVLQWVIYFLFALFQAYLYICLCMYLVYSLQQGRYNKFPITQIMQPSQQYQSQLSQLVQLKKQLQSSKQSHNDTLAQLQLSYSLNKQLQQVIKSQTNTINSLYKQLSQRSNKLSQVTGVYEQQLQELKQFVNARDRQLHAMRGSLVVTDYDVIRLRVISQLEIGHREQLEERNREVERLNKLFNDEKVAKQVTNQKYLHVRKEMDRLVEENLREKEESQRKYMRQVNKMHDKVQLQYMARKQSQKQLQILQKKHQNLQQKYDNQFSTKHSKASLSPQPHSHSYSYPTRPGEPQTSALRQSLQSRTQQLESLRRKFEKQQSRHQQTINDLESKIRDMKIHYVEYGEHVAILREKEKEHEAAVAGYERKIGMLREDGLSEVERVRREGERMLEEFRGRVYTEREKYKENIDTNATPQANPLQVHNLQQEIKSLQKQNQTLRTELAQHKNQKIPNRSGSANPNTNTDTNTNTRINSSINQYKAKLQEANQRIVSLLLEKVTLKKEVQRLSN